VAIYGSNTPGAGDLLTARSLALAIRRRGAVLLTGGDVGEPGTVKGAAISAVMDDATPDEPARWLGVANQRRAGAPRWRGPTSVVVTPGWGHRRNLVEAVICDAAFALGVGSAGTASEALFCLWLGRPVVLVGDVSAAQAEARALRSLASRERLPRPDNTDLAVDRGIRDAYDWADRPHRSADRRPRPEDAEAADALLAELVDRIAQPSPRPDVGALVDEAGWDAYLASAVRHREADQAGDHGASRPSTG
jgi:predicted Rossmann-fold nucleotide-binding protein